MGCISSKSAVEDCRDENTKGSLIRKGSLDKLLPQVNSSRREEIVRSKTKNQFHGSFGVKAALIDDKAPGSNRFYYDDHVEKASCLEKVEVIDENKLDTYEVVAAEQPGIGKVHKSIQGEQVAAGWPSWLVTVAGEAIKGWVPRRANTFERLDKIGQGTYSSVYKARDVVNDKLVALKKVRFDNHDSESVRFMAREIVLLRRLDHPNVIKLEGLITSPTSCSLYLVFEYMEHDLVGLSSLPGKKFSEPQIKCYMHQLLSGLDHCHSHGVLHRDIKGSNLLIDSSGVLKIADFGLASSFDSKNTSPMTSRVVTLWYRPPELLLGGTRYGVAVDLWSTGCILGELYAGKPILPGKTEVEQLHKIFKLCGSPSDEYWKKSKLPHSTVFKPVQPYRRRVAETFKDFPSPVVDLMETLLSIDPVGRGTASAALKSEFFTTEPLACDPSSLPNYPPSKEIDAKLRDEEARRQRATGSKDQRAVMGRSGPLEQPHVNVSNANAEQPSGQRRIPQLPQPCTKSKNGMFKSNGADDGSVFPTNKRNQVQVGKEGNGDVYDYNRKRVSHSGPLVHAPGWRRSVKEHEDPPIFAARANLSNLSGLVATRTSASEVNGDKSLPEGAEFGRSRRSFNQLDYSGKQDQRHHAQKSGDSPHSSSAMKHTTKEAIPHVRGQRGNKMYMSGPLLVPSNNMDQLLKEHDRKFQEYARRARLDRTKQAGKVLIQGR